MFERILSCILLVFQYVDSVEKILMKEKIAMRKTHAVIAENADILLSNAVPRSPTRLPIDVSGTYMNYCQMSHIASYRGVRGIRNAEAWFWAKPSLHFSYNHCLHLSLYLLFLIILEKASARMLNN